MGPESTQMRESVHKEKEQSPLGNMRASSGELNQNSEPCAEKEERIGKCKKKSKYGSIQSTIIYDLKMCLL